MKFDFEEFDYDEEDVFLMPSTSLAFVGDALFSLFARVKVMNTQAKSGKFHALATKMVKASAQAKILDSLLPTLTEREENVVRRAKNAHTTSKSKNAGLADYKKATAFEALLGYLYLTKNTKRLNEVLTASLEVELWLFVERMGLWKPLGLMKKSITFG